MNPLRAVTSLSDISAFESMPRVSKHKSSVNSLLLQHLAPGFLGPSGLTFLQHTWTQAARMPVAAYSRIKGESVS
jgi:hypothetical protein